MLGRSSHSAGAKHLHAPSWPCIHAATFSARLCAPFDRRKGIVLGHDSRDFSALSFIDSTTTAIPCQRKALALSPETLINCQGSSLKAAHAFPKSSEVHALAASVQAHVDRVSLAGPSSDRRRSVGRVQDRAFLVGVENPTASHWSQDELRRYTGHHGSTRNNHEDSVPSAVRG